MVDIRKLRKIRGPVESTTATPLTPSQIRQRQESNESYRDRMEKVETLHGHNRHNDPYYGTRSEGERLAAEQRQLDREAAGKKRLGRPKSSDSGLTKGEKKAIAKVNKLEADARRNLSAFSRWFDTSESGTSDFNKLEKGKATPSKAARKAAKTAKNNKAFLINQANLAAIMDWQEDTKVKMLLISRSSIDSSISGIYDRTPVDTRHMLDSIVVNIPGKGSAGGRDTAVSGYWDYKKRQKKNKGPTWGSDAPSGTYVSSKGGSPYSASNIPALLNTYTPGDSVIFGIEEPIDTNEYSTDVNDYGSPIGRGKNFVDIAEWEWYDNVGKWSRIHNWSKFTGKSSKK